MVQVPAFGRMADVCCVEQQGQGFGLVDANEENRKKKTTTSIHLFMCSVFFFSFFYKYLVTSLVQKP